MWSREDLQVRRLARGQAIVVSGSRPGDGRILVTVWTRGQVADGHHVRISRVPAYVSRLYDPDRHTQIITVNVWASKGAQRLCQPCKRSPNPPGSRVVGPRPCLLHQRLPGWFIHDLTSLRQVSWGDHGSSGRTTQILQHFKTPEI